MSRGYYVPCAPFLYLVPDSGGAPGMDCLPLQQRSPGPFHYLIHEQAKSLVALQELQNEVGALLEFRELVMETFPHLRHKMGTPSTSSNITNPPSSGSNIPIPVVPAVSRREWEPGIRVRRKLGHKDAELSVSRKALPQQPKSGEGINSGSGTSSAGSSAVQDSGFGTETSSSKEPRPGPSSEAEDELWNLLDVIHRKGSKLRDEVEHLQRRERERLLQHNVDETIVKDMERERLRPQSLDTPTDDEVRGLRRERDVLLDKVAEMEAEALASRVRASQLQTEVGSLVAAKRDLEERLRATVAQKGELNSRIHDLHQQFVSGRSASVCASPRLRRPLTDPTSRRPSEGCGGLGALDGIVSSPSRLPRATPDPQQVAAILQEFNPVELQRHLLTTAVENKVLQKRLDKASKCHVGLLEQLDKVKDENDDLKFQLEEKSIELEGTRARVRVLERLQQKALPSQEVSSEEPILPPDATPNPILPLLALPMPMEDNIHHSSSTESAHDHGVEPQSSDLTMDTVDLKKEVSSPRKRPSKIPLPGMKSYCAPKPPSGKTATGKSRDSHSWKSKADSSTSLSSKTTRETSWKNRSDSNCSRDSPSGGRTSSLSGRHNSRESLSGNKSRDSLPGKGRSDSLSGKKCSGDSMSCGKARDPPSQNSFSSSVSAANKRDSISSKSKDSSFSSPGGRKGLHHQMSTRRVSNSSVSRGNLLDQSDQNSKAVTSSDSLEPKLSSSLASNSIADVILDQHGDSFSDSLNQFSNQEPDPPLFKSSNDANAFSISISDRNSAYQVSNVNSTNAFPWNSSSSEYFDSINNSGSVFNNTSLLRSCSYLQEQYLHSSSRHEGLAECDSLENKETEGIDDENEVGKYSVNVDPALNLWVTSDKQPSDW